MGLEKLNILKKKKGLTNKDLAYKTGIPKSTIDKITSGANPNPQLETVRAIVYALGYSLNDLDDENEMDPPHSHRIARAYDLADDRDKRTVDNVLEPYMEDEDITYIEMRVMEESAAAGAGNYLSSDDAYDLLSFPTSEVARKADFGVRISGESMEPKYPDGCIVWVECCPHIDEGQDGIFIYEEHAYCKKLSVDRENKRITLQSINPACDDVEVAGQEPYALHTVGRVVGCTTHKGR